MTGNPVPTVGRWRALVLWTRGRRAPVTEDSSAFPAAQGTLGLPMMFAAVTVIEMVVLELVIPWRWVSIALAALSLASLVVLASSVAMSRVHPHVLAPTTLTLRMSGKVVASVDRDAVVSARIHRRYGRTSPTLEGGRLMLPNQDGTNIDIELCRAVGVSVPAPLQRWRIAGTADVLSLHVDDPGSLCAALTRP